MIPTHSSRAVRPAGRSGALRRRLIGLGVVGALALAACGGDDDSAPATTAAPTTAAPDDGGDDATTTTAAPEPEPEVPTVGGELTVGTVFDAFGVEPATFVGGVTDGHIALAIFDPIMMMTPSGTPEPWLATSLESDDS